MLGAQKPFGKNVKEPKMENDSPLQLEIDEESGAEPEKFVPRIKLGYSLQSINVHMFLDIID